MAELWTLRSLGPNLTDNAPDASCQKSDAQVTEPRSCSTCGREVASRYCPDCGERQLRSSDLTLGHLIGQAIETISNADGRVFGSVRDLVIRPGALTAAYIEGRRKPYFAPLPLFLLINVAFFAVQTISGWRIFSTPLYSHLQYQIYSGAARAMAADRLAAMQTTMDHYAPVFDQAAELNAKSLVILMVPPLALIVWLLLGRRSRPFVTHVVFAIHFFAFVLQLYSVLLAVAAVASRLLGVSGSALNGWLTLFHLAMDTPYLYGAAGTAYEETGVARVLNVVTLAAAVPAILLGYRFAIFLITLYAT